MDRDELYGPYWMVRIENTQLDIFKTIPVARILVHTFEELKAMDNGRGRRPFFLTTARYGGRGTYTWKLVFGLIFGTSRLISTDTKMVRGAEYGT